MYHNNKLSDRIIQQMQEDILKGRFKPNEKLPAEPELMKLYNVGRSTIREAVKSLAMSGILKVQQGNGTFLSEARSSETLEERLRRANSGEIYQVRHLLEKELLKLSIINRTEQDLANMAQYLEIRKKAIEMNAYEICAEADINFHLAIASSSSNYILFDLYKGFSKVILDFFSRRDERDLGRFISSHTLHVALYKAIKSRKPRKAEQLLNQLLTENY